MCFEIDTNKCPRAKSSKRDVVAYKMLSYISRRDKTYKSPFQNTKYTVRPGKTFYAKRKSRIGPGQWTGGRRSRWQRLERFEPNLYGDITTGLHSYKTLAKAMTNSGKGVYHDILRFVIPAGTPYYENGTERVSLQLRFVEVVHKTKN